jgi:general stress protein YciG
MATDNRGLGSSNMSESEKQDMSELGKKGAEAQPTEAKRRGGEPSHGGGR